MDDAASQVQLEEGRGFVGMVMSRSYIIVIRTQYFPLTIIITNVHFVQLSLCLFSVSLMHFNISLAPCQIGEEDKYEGNSNSSVVYRVSLKGLYVVARMLQAS